MYRLHIEVAMRANIARSERTLDEWHRALGHPDINQLKNVYKRNCAENFKIIAQPRDNECGSCPAGKAHHVHHPSSGRVRATEILYRVHADLVGPSATPSIGGSRYFLLLKDEYTTCMFVYLIHSKDTVPQQIKNFVNEMAIRTEKRVKIIRSDNGKEFCNNELKAFYESEGIIQELSAPMTPQQNGEAERANRTIIERARTMLTASGLPYYLWSEAVATAVYLSNRITNSKVQDKTPYELFTGHPPSYGHLIEFGRQLHLLNNAGVRSKFDSKTIEVFMVGYGQRFNTYRVFDPIKGKVVVSSDITIAPHGPKTITNGDPASNSASSPTNVLSKQNIEGHASERETNKDEEIYCNTRSHPEDEPIADKTFDVPAGNHQVVAYDPSVVQNQTPNMGRFNSPQSIDPLQRALGINADETTRQQVYPSAPPLVDPRVSSLRPTAGRSESWNIPVTPPARTNVLDRLNRLFKKIVKTKPANVTHNFAKTAKIAHGDPMNYHAAISGPDSMEWKDAIVDELAAHEENKTWSFVTKPPNIKEISVKWIFKTKHHPDGTIERRKARLVARGFSQREGVDYQEIFSPVVRIDSVRLLFSIAAQFGLQYKQFDVTTAFLHGTIPEDLYIRPPEGLDIVPGQALKLNKSLYGLKQASRCWSIKFSQLLRDYNLRQTISDPCVFVNNGSEMMFLAIYVDDGLVFAKDMRSIDRLIDNLISHLKVKLVDSGVFIGIQIHRNPHDGSYFLNQSGYIARTLEGFAITEAKPVATPLEAGHDLHSSKVLEQHPNKDLPYAEAVGKLLYCAMATRPDIAHTLSILSKYASYPRDRHWIAVKRVLRYLKGTINHGLLYKRVKEPNLVCFTDADYAGDHENSKSTSGMVTFVCTGPVCYKAQQQSLVAKSTTEAEYIAASMSSDYIVWLQQFSKELGVLSDMKSSLMCDNQSALKLMRNSEFHARTKAIRIRFHSIRELVNDDVFDIEYVPSEENTADIFTKALSGPKFTYHREGLSCVELGTATLKRG